MSNHPFAKSTYLSWITIGITTQVSSYIHETIVKKEHRNHQDSSRKLQLSIAVTTMLQQLLLGTGGTFRVICQPTTFFVTVNTDVDDEYKLELNDRNRSVFIEPREAMRNQNMNARHLFKMRVNIYIVDKITNNENFRA
jgi:hypothetical protein